MESTRSPKILVNRNNSLPRSGKMEVCITRETVAEAVGGALQLRFGQMRHATKRIARMIGASAGTAQGLLHGKRAPDSAALINLMAECPEVLAVVLILAGRMRPETKEQVLAALNAKSETLERRRDELLASLVRPVAGEADQLADHIRQQAEEQAAADVRAAALLRDSSVRAAAP